MRTIKAAVANNAVENTTRRSSVTICYLNIVLENRMKADLLLGSVG